MDQERLERVRMMGAVPAVADGSIGDLREAVLDVLIGYNVRTRTEVQTRRRLLEEQTALLHALIELEADATDDTPTVLDAIRALLLGDGGDTVRAVGKDRERLQRAVGLPKKTLANLSNRAGDDKDTVLLEYIDMLGCVQNEVATNLEALLPEFEIRLGGRRVRDPISLLLLYATASGANALARRGSDKSRNGKRLERLILGSVLHVYGLKLVAPGSDTTNGYWLSYYEKDTREADATVLLADGTALKIDIGFIGGGNPEIVKDKLSRYQRRERVAGQERAVHTAIIVDKVLPGSGAWDQAKEAGVTLVQMADDQWFLTLHAAFATLLPVLDSTSALHQITSASDRTSRRTILESAISIETFSRIDAGGIIGE